MPGILSIRSNVKQFLKKNFPSNAERTKRMAAAMRKIGRIYVARVQRKYLSGRPGLNRRTGHAARTWYSTVVSPNRIDRMKLVAWTSTFYTKFHADVYKPKRQPRRFPPRVLVGAEWDAMTARGGIVDATIGDAYMPPGSPTAPGGGGGLHYGLVSKQLTFLRRGAGGRFMSFKSSKKAPGSAWAVQRDKQGRFTSVRRVR